MARYNDDNDDDDDDDDRNIYLRDLHAICSECVRVQQGFDCRLWFLMKKIPTMHKINKIKKLLPLSINYKTHSCDSFDFKSLKRDSFNV